MAELSTLKKCLERYCEWSRQEISLENSGLFPSKGVSQQFLNQVKRCWGIKKISSKAKYLGVPLFLTNNRSRDLASIKERLENKLSSWKSNSLSWVGRATLIKSVAQSMPTYSPCQFSNSQNLCAKKWTQWLEDSGGISNLRMGNTSPLSPGPHVLALKGRWTWL